MLLTYLTGACSYASQCMEAYLRGRPFPSQMMVRRPASPSTEEDWIILAHAKIDALKDLAIIDPDHPLIFRNNPDDHGAFRWPSDREILIPNHGVHSLTGHQVNPEFLSMENQFCALIAIISGQNAQDDQANALVDCIHNELGILTRQKEVQWAQQRGNSGTGKPFFQYR